MKKREAIIVDPANIPTLGKFDDSEFDVLLYEFKGQIWRSKLSLGRSAAAYKSIR